MTQKPDNNESVLSRWSRRKLDNKAVTEREETLAESQEQASVPTPEQPVVDDAELPIWQQLNVDPEAKRAALSSLFRQPEFNVVDRMNEYDEDFTQFKSLGNIVTQQMKYMIKVAEQKTRLDEEAIKRDSTDIADMAPSSEQTKHMSEAQNYNEDNEIA